jgi:uncharacterized protein
VSVALLDVNVLIALLDRRHVHHEHAHGWFAAAQAKGWATCPLTQNAVLRILGLPRYPNSPGSRLLEANQLTDTYLLALAVHRGGRLVSFDRRLSCEGVAGGREALWLIDA